MEIQEILERYPYLVPRNNKFTLFRGFIHVEEEEFNVTLKIPNYPKLDGIAVVVSTNDGLILDLDYDESEFSLLLFEFLQRLESKLIPYVPIKAEQYIRNYRFMNDFEPLISNNGVKIEINSEMNEFTILDRGHYLQVKYADSNTYTLIEHSLPRLIDSEHCKKFKDNMSLDVLYKIFKENLQHLDKFYADLYEIDNICYVIDPPKPTTKDTHRQIFLGDNTSAIVHLNPWEYGGIPTLSFIGPDRSTEKFKESVSHNLQNWNTETNLFRNLLSLFGLVYFPSRLNEPSSPTTGDEDNGLLCEGECCICFTERLNDILPEVVCENKSCGRYFHKQCLYEWLTSIGTGETPFDFIQGNCPNCDKTITCPVM